MLVSTPAQADPARQNPFNTVQQLGRALVIVENHYVQPVDRTKLVEGAVKGMVAELDPHSVYMNRAEYESFRNETEGSFVGIGVEVDMRDNLPTIIRPIDGSPAERAGLQPADQIVAIDGWYTNGKPLDTILQRIRGQRGTSVRLHIRRPGVDKPIAVTIIRADVHVRSVVAQRLDGNIAYIIIKQFQRGTHTEFLQAIGKLRLESDSRLEGLILDLRTNPGGLVHESVQIADELLDSGTIFSTRARGRVLDQIVASSGGAACQLPLAVIVNELTASAAELVAGAIQDNQRGVIVGAPTFGKGSVQSIIELPDGAALKLTTTLYFTPQGRSIQALGITPNVIVNQPGPNSGLPVVREQDIDGHILSPERDPTEP
ncbi:MAG: S41 family peptidase, partial [Polyangiaceae bacterium]|nr:S41 family peptidase [Polyangiaceae bacterium]